MLIKAIIALLKRFYWCIRWDILSTIEGYYGDKKLGIDTGFYNEKIMQGTYGDSVKYEPTRYATIQKVVKYLKLNKDDIFVDFGCGKGRVIFYIATQRIKKVIGIDFDEKMINIAKANIHNLNNTPIEILNIDAINYNPIEGTIFFMFNPFGSETLKTVLNNVRGSLITHPRRIRIVYHNPMCQNILEMQNWLELEGGIDNSSYSISVWRNKLS